MPEDSYLSEAYSTSSKTRAFEHHKHLTRHWGRGMELVWFAVRVVHLCSLTRLGMHGNKGDAHAGNCQLLPVFHTFCKDYAAMIQPARPLQCKTCWQGYDLTTRAVAETFWFPCGLRMATPLARHSPVPKCPLFNAMNDAFRYQECVRNEEKRRMEETNLDFSMSNPKGLLDY
jgi:hypothetical protein